MKRIFVIIILSLFILPLSFAKAQSFSTLENSVLSYEQIASSPKAILFVWTTWCSYCREEIQRLTKKCTFLDDINFFYVNVGEKTSKVQAFSKKVGFLSCIKSKIILDEEGFFAKKFSVYALPTFVFLKNGKAVHKSYFMDDELLKSIFK